MVGRKDNRRAVIEMCNHCRLADVKGPSQVDWVETVIGSCVSALCLSVVAIHEPVFDVVASVLLATATITLRA